jgi:hypothetical protein
MGYSEEIQTIIQTTPLQAAYDSIFGFIQKNTVKILMQRLNIMIYLEQL